MKTITAAFLSVALVAAPSASLADLTFDCKKAINFNDEDEVRRIAEILKSAPPQSLSVLQVSWASECLETATGVFHRYDQETHTFIPDEAAGRAKRAQDEQEQMERDRIRKEQEQQAANERAEFEAQSKRLQKEVEENRKNREDAVLQRLVEGCRNMYLRDPDETITNKVCFDVFMTTGLPDG